MEVSNKRNSYSVSKNHNIICTGGSYIKGFTNVVKNLVSNNLEMYNVLKPGTSSSHLNETANQEIKEIKSG